MAMQLLRRWWSYIRKENEQSWEAGVTDTWMIANDTNTHVVCCLREFDQAAFFCFACFGASVEVPRNFNAFWQSKFRLQANKVSSGWITL